MTFNKSRWSGVDVRAHNRDRITTDLGDGPSGSTLGEASRVNSEPCYNERDRGIGTEDDKTRSEHLSLDISNGDEDNITDHRYAVTYHQRVVFLVDTVTDNVDRNQ